MFPSLDNDCTVQDLAFQVLNPFRANSFNIRPLPSNNYVFDDLVFQDMNASDNDCQDLAATVSKSHAFFCSTFGIPSFELLHFFAIPCPQVLTMIALFKSWLSKSWNVLQETVWSWDLSKNWIMSFMTWSSKTWTQVKIFVKTWLPQVWNLAISMA